MRFDQGWVKLHRLRYDHWLEQDGLAWAVLMKLIQWACYDDSPPNAKIQLKRGQCVTSTIQLAKLFGVDRQRIRNKLSLMQEASVINQQKNQRGIIVTILNYDKYQTKEKEETNSKTIEKPTENQQKTIEKPLTKELKTLRTKEVKNEIQPEALAPPTASPARDFIAHYCESYKAKYQTNPVIDGRSAATATRIVKSVGLEKAKQLVSRYLEMHDQWFVTKSHDLLTFENNLNKVAIFENTGQRISQEQAKRADITQSNDAAFARMAERIKREEAR